jgi:hypothetical protein
MLRAEMRKTTFLIFTISLLLIGCALHQHRAAVKKQMLSIYEISERLFGFVRDSKSFFAEENDAEIKDLLTKLSTNFHKVDKISGVQHEEPGFDVVLKVNIDALSDVKRRFEEGNKDYSFWKLKSLTGNCVACHARFGLGSEFIGKVPEVDPNDVPARIARAEFLFASRQYEIAGDELFNITAILKPNGKSVYNALSLLKLWLVVEVRAQEHYQQAADKLTSLLTSDALAQSDKEVAVSWIKELEFLATLGDRSAAHPLREANWFLSMNPGESLDDDLAHMVTSLHVTAILHRYLDQPISSENRRKAIYLLASAYYHIPIDLFDTARELYFEQLIREFPETEEARHGFALYKDWLEFSRTGSGGTNFDDADLEKLKELKTLAFGKVSES